MSWNVTPPWDDVRNYVDGDWQPPRSSDGHDVVTPATGETISYVGFSSEADVDDELPPTAKSSLIIGTYLAEEFGIEFYARAKNMILELERQLTAALDRCDALVMPTVPLLPYERDDSLDRIGRLDRVVENHRNTATFDHTHHPALTVPCGSVDGLPVGAQLVGSHFDEATLFTAARAIERITDSPTVPVSPNPTGAGK